MKKEICGVVLFSLLVTFSCNNNDDSLLTESTIEYTEIGRGALYGNGQEGITQTNLVISNQIDWGNLMNQMNSFSNTTDNFSEIDIDFENFTVVAIFLEVRGSGWEIEISNVTETENSVNVTKIETPYVNPVMTQPFCIIKIPNTEKPIFFE